MKKIFTLLLALLIIALPLTACNDPANTDPSPDPDSIVLRIEGNSDNLFYGKVAIGDNSNLKDLLTEFDKTNNDINIEGEENAYITKINNEAGGAYGGWDGWCVLVNGESPAVGIGDITVNKGDEVILYYGDPWGVGMAYPEFEVKGNHIIFSTSTDISATGTVSNIKVTVDGTVYQADENGVVNLNKSLASGSHTLQIELKSENGLCLALRYAPGFTFKVK